ncbi:hypothetical protein TNIN_167251 [Trichonephila inaurata madagascariensis]|uniref:Uncharacterized protein n=1 Tax=Trichonephila inaurata madagascariensis TaxID=2747483 RepID=A0A8X6IND1_9ARAC|nr:hypothetical protein TNIN_167251 [Trichonephila inaurata madagascariensis]
MSLVTAVNSFLTNSLTVPPDLEVMVGQRFCPLIKPHKRRSPRSHRASCPDGKFLSTTFYYDQFDLSVVCEMFRYLHVIMEMRPPNHRRPKMSSVVWWFGATLTILCTQKRVITSKLGVSSSFQANFLHSLHWGPRNK